MECFSWRLHLDLIRRSTLNMKNHETINCATAFLLFCLRLLSIFISEWINAHIICQTCDFMVHKLHALLVHCHVWTFQKPSWFHPTGFFCYQLMWSYTIVHSVFVVVILTASWYHWDIWTYLRQLWGINDTNKRYLSVIVAHGPNAHIGCVLVWIFYT